jgi:hypothetical protein
MESFLAISGASGPIFLFCTPRIVFGGIEGDWSRFRRNRGRRVLFSCFALPDSFLAVPWASAPVFMFCPPGVVSRGAEGIRSRFHVLRSRTHFRQYRGCRVPFSCFARPDSFSAIPRASANIFIFYSRTHFRRYRGRQVPFSCFARPEPFLAEPRASGPVFMFCAPVVVSRGTGGVGSRFHILRSRTHFRRYQGRRVPFLYFVLPQSFPALPRVSGPVFMFCAPGLVFGGILIFTKLHVVMLPTIYKNSNNLFEQLFLMHLNYVLCKNYVVQCSYRSVN